MTDSPLSLHQLTKHYETIHALQEVTFSLNSGEIFGLIGLNGAGKTTLIKTVLQLTSATRGEARIFGIPHTEVRSRNHLAYLPEKFQPSKYLTGYEYLDLSASYYKLKLDTQKAQEIALALDFPVEKLGHKISSYSKGTAQKIGLIGTFLLDRPLLILDEPMSGLDPMARIRLKQKMQRYREQGHTLFFSSHILSDMDEICDRVAILHQGTLRYLGTPQDFKQDYPAASLEASFLNAIAA